MAKVEKVEFSPSFIDFEMKVGKPIASRFLSFVYGPIDVSMDEPRINGWVQDRTKFIDEIKFLLSMLYFISCTKKEVGTKKL